MTSRSAVIGEVVRLDHRGRFEAGRGQAHGAAAAGVIEEATIV
ncbi:hypothetical protein [Amycolatopsis jiangsuensis]|uniref:Uncharacterized protein n=1 Tax=Amycolatopsis jiangsuensis TaxID=1181879 RepID=A0A840J8F8_9PSEU|nr:hypothetical protein [Amycolatopsis jiangsuensis]MBB4689668.1 hypothetical protein [Amycolatopsis jiangsuensis]